MVSFVFGEPWYERTFSERKVDAVTLSTAYQLTWVLFLVSKTLTLTTRGLTRRPIMTSKIDFRTVRVKLFLMSVHPYHPCLYSNESEKPE